ncbi:HAD hydrolase-like protein [Falsiroseomonas sp. HW251]|uniref:HAD hydrolase-like protein n=1 Tax=Falsiroseomonas sp. HW251 TaxID=3390998 RepID=UPI003D320ACC
MTPRLVIFDFDGTLADSWPWFLTTLDGTADRFGLARITPAKADALRGQDTGAILKQLGVPIWKVPAIAAHLRAEVLRAPPPPLFPGIPELLRRLARRGIVTAIASSNSEAQVARTLGGELLPLIAHRALEASLFGKPAKLKRLLREAGVAPADALFIGDEVRDIEAARDAGVAIGAVAWGYASPALLAARKPDAMFDTPEAIAEFCRA